MALHSAPLARSRSDPPIVWTIAESERKRTISCSSHSCRTACTLWLCRSSIRPDTPRPCRRFHNDIRKWALEIPLFHRIGDPVSVRLRGGLPLLLECFSRSKAIAPSGHSSTHRPQPMHRLTEMYALLFTEMAPTGQEPSHTPQPLHFCKSTIALSGERFAPFWSTSIRRSSASR